MKTSAWSDKMNKECYLLDDPSVDLIRVKNMLIENLFL